MNRPIDTMNGQHTKIVAIRHAQTTHNRPPKRYQGRLDVSLSDEGVMDARRHSAQFGWARRIVSSPARRCRQTLDALGLSDREIRFDERLWEIDVGRWEGREVQRVAAEDEQAHERWKSRPDTTSPGGGENLIEMRVRCFAAINDIFADTSDVPTLVVTHGGPIRLWTLALAARPLSEFHTLEIGNLHSLTIDGEKWADIATDGISRQ